MASEVQQGLEAILKTAPVIPVMVIDNQADAVPLARALVEGGLPVLEITLRTPAAFESIRAIIAEVGGAKVGAGTVLHQRQLREIEQIGCAFAVSPGSTPSLLEAARDSSVPFLPGASTASECMSLFDRAYRFQKFFPAEPAGGIAYLTSLQSPLPQVNFCPTGGIAAAKARDYLKLANVICVGGSWMAPKKLIAARDWPAIESLARESAALWT